MITKQKITEALSRIKASESLDQRVLNATVYKKEKKIIFKKNNFLKITLVTIFSLVLITITSVAAKDFIYKIILNKTQIEDGSYKQAITISEPVHITQDKNTSCNNLTTLSNLESSLDIKFVFDTKKYNKKIDKCDIKINDYGEVESVKIAVSEFYKFSEGNGDKIVDIYISFMTPVASEETKEEFKNLGKVTGTNELNNVEFYAENINTLGFYFILPSERIPLSKTAMFVHNNILYELNANRQVTIEELLEIINQF